MERAEYQINQLPNLALETEAVLEDIFLSGFCSLRQGTLDKLEELADLYQTYGMKEGHELLFHLKELLYQEKESFVSDLKAVTETYCRLEFYLEHFKSRISQE